MTKEGVKVTETPTEEAELDEATMADKAEDSTEEVAEQQQEKRSLKADVKIQKNMFLTVPQQNKRINTPQQ